MYKFANAFQYKPSYWERPLWYRDTLSIVFKKNLSTMGQGYSMKEIVYQ